MAKQGMGAKLMQWAPAILDTGLGLTRGKKNREFAREQQRNQFANQKALNRQGFELSKKMWEETNYDAQAKQLKKAGLNPALMYGQAGAGGTTSAGSGGSAGGGNAVQEDTGRGMGMMMIQQQLLNAQKENIQADTKLKEATANKTSGVDTEEAKTRIADLTQGIKNKQAQEKLTNAQQKIAQVESEIKDATANVKIQEIVWTAEYALEQLQQARNETYISNETREEKVKQIKTTTIGLAIENEAKQKGIQLTEAQTRSVTEAIEQNWRRIDQDQEGLDIKSFEADLKARDVSLWNAVGGEVKRSINIINGATGDRGGYNKRK